MIFACNSIFTPIKQAADGKIMIKGVRTFCTFLVFFISYYLAAQSITNGAPFSGYIDGVYFSTSSNFKIRFAFINDEPEVELTLDWFKVNYVQYKGVRYDMNNHPGGSANFDYVRDGVVQTIKLTENVPTVGYQSLTRTMYSAGTYEFRFDVDKSKWQSLGMEGRAREKQAWKNRKVLGTLSCESISGAVVRNIIAAVKSKHNSNQASSSSSNSISSGQGGNSYSSGSKSNASSNSSGYNSNQSSSASAQRKSSGNSNTSNYQRQQEQQRKKQADQQAQRQAYNDFMRQQNSRNEAAAAAGAMAGIGVLTILGKAIYGKMGIFNPADAYEPGAVNVKGSCQFGYSQLVQPMWFNSEYTNSFGTNTGLDYTYAWPTCFGLALDLGLEHDYGGIEGYASLRGGSSIFITNYMVDYNYGFRAYAGLPNLQGYFEQGYGSRSLFMNDWITAEQNGSGESNMIWENIKYGLRVNWGQFVRHHISLGVINEAVGGINGTSVQPLENFNPDYDPNSNGINNGTQPGELYETKFVQGYFLEWKKDHSFNFFLQVYPNYPFTGDRNYPASESDQENNIDGGVLVNVGFVRSIDGFLAF